MESYQNVKFARGGPLWFGPTNPLKCASVAFGGIVATICYWSTPLQSLFRYFLVCRRKVLSIFTTIAIQLFVVSISIAVSIGYFFEYRPINEAPEKLQLLKNLSVWQYETGVEENFCFANIKRPNVAIFCVVIVLLINTGFAVLIFTSWRIYAFLRSSETHMSAKTKGTLLPAFAAVLIIVIIGLAYFMESYDGGAYVFLFYPYCLNSFINPLITICCVHRYRQTTARILYGKKVMHSSECATITRRNTLVKSGQEALSSIKRSSLPVTNNKM
uniref:G_PROTEIN_RECEP_F1_2 domain-containing protein n=1 Tax=Panagrellus redivivus TaxID=6233 RepID=A0A7E5A248_PANRE